mmetsp:Transcript_107091/g.160094  ORF Transcript_107091/g.160094 Transcript_107091/m.160094 type:complete len:162 (-) Transcript_107091:78-563(-)
MPRSNGYRCNTRDLFSRPFRKHGMPSLQTYLTVYRVGDYVDVVANSAVHKGMPHKYYHGKTGIVWSVTPRAVGVELNKKVGNRIMRKRIFVRIEHVQKSKCREHFLTRVKQNETLKRAAKENNQPKICLKRDPGWPVEAKLVRTKDTTIENVTPIPYEFVV